jgi:hypothetical protein
MQKLFFEDNLCSYAEWHIPQITFHNCRKKCYITFEGLLIVQKLPAMNNMNSEHYALTKILKCRK